MQTGDFASHSLTASGAESAGLVTHPEAGAVLKGMVECRRMQPLRSDGRLGCRYINRLDILRVLALIAERHQCPDTMG